MYIIPGEYQPKTLQFIKTLTQSLIWTEYSEVVINYVCFIETYCKAWHFRGMQFKIFIISLHAIFAELTIYYMGYLTAVKFRCM